ncbi:peptidoglycan-binding protein [Streptomyces sp. NPDC014861]|uniref:peptidoglycan-binding domain-containing protein n=1 Tax=Streptomyces sp. NPDC014861 TaxID=3364923 RepID=UPI00370096C4
MRNPEPESRPASRDHDVFGKVARPDGAGPGARVQDLALFDATPAPPRRAHGSRRKKRGGGPSLPLLIVGSLAAGIGLAVGLTSGLDRAGPDELTLTMPDLPEAPSATPDLETPHPEATDAMDPAGVAKAEAAEGGARTGTATPGVESPGPGPSRTGSAPPPVTSAAPSSVGPAAPAASSSTARPPAPARTSAPPATRPPASPTASARPSGRPDPGVLRVGSTGPEVEDLQRRLQRLHLYLGSADGTFGGFLEAALSRFQEARDIPEERGVYGPLTRAALHAETGRGGGGGGWGGWGEGEDDEGDWGSRRD